MTEAEWLACESPTPMLTHVGVNPRDRRILFYASGILFDRPDLLTPDLMRWGNTVDQVCDGEADAEVLIGTAVWNVYELARSGWSGTRAHYSAISHIITHVSRREPDEFEPDLPLEEFNVPQEELQPVCRVCAELLRDIFGNPFRPVPFVADWRTSTVLSLAQQMYESRDFSAMPILADALQDAGCDNDDVLTHCRGTGPHVRGCWVVDHVLGKE